MSENHKPRFPADLIGLLIGALMLGGLLVYGAVSQQPLPLLPALAVIAVNVVAAGRIAYGVHKRRTAANALQKNSKKA